MAQAAVVGAILYLLAIMTDLAVAPSQDIS